MRGSDLLVKIAAVAALAPGALGAQAPEAILAKADAEIGAVLPKVVEWRRDIHQHPELSNQEFRTAALVAEHLRGLGLEVETGVARTGVVGVLRGGRPGPVVALRADMDALPVTEQVDLPFASRETAEYNGETVGVMHACGHDNHVAILMGAAQVLAAMREDLPGTVKFIFQPAEEGSPPGVKGGAELMVQEGVLEDPAPEAIFGLHVGVFPAHVGRVSYRPGGTMAAADYLKIVVRGRQTHGAKPWEGVDPIVAASQVVLGLQTIASRQINVTQAPAVVTVGRMEGGVRNNIIPDSVVLEGTIRTFDPEMQTDIHQRVRRTAEEIARSAGAEAVVRIDRQVPVTHNDPGLTDRMLPSLRAVAGDTQVVLTYPTTGAEDFSFFQQRIPGLYFFLGAAPDGADLSKIAPNHSPRFFVDEGVLPLGVEAMTRLTLDYLYGG